MLQATAAAQAQAAGQAAAQAEAAAQAQASGASAQAAVRTGWKSESIKSQKPSPLLHALPLLVWQQVVPCIVARAACLQTGLQMLTSSRLVLCTYFHGSMGLCMLCVPYIHCKGLMNWMLAQLEPPKFCHHINAVLGAGGSFCSGPGSRCSNCTGVPLDCSHKCSCLRCPWTFS